MGWPWKFPWGKVAPKVEVKVGQIWIRDTTDPWNDFRILIRQVKGEWVRISYQFGFGFSSMEFSKPISELRMFYKLETEV
jgi:hypothetical protein